MSLDYQRILMFGVNMSEKDENYTEEEYLKDFGIDEDADWEEYNLLENDFGCLNIGGCCDGDIVVGVPIDIQDSESDVNLDSFTMHDMLEFERQFYDELEKHNVLKKYGKGKFMIFNYIY